jgi:hypothetical protein
LNLGCPTSSPSLYGLSHPGCVPFSIRQIFYTNCKSKSTLIEFEEAWNEEFVGYIKTLSQTFPENCEEIYEKNNEIDGLQT